MSNDNTSPFPKSMSHKPAPLPTLNPNEQADFERLKIKIHEGLGVFYQVGNAIMEIQERRLYRATHESFKAFMKDEFDISRQQAHRLMGAAEVVSNLLSAKSVSPIGDTDLAAAQILPTSESVVRPLTKLPPKRQVEVWTEAVKQSSKAKPTAKEVQAIIQKRVTKTRRMRRAINASAMFVMTNEFDETTGVSTITIRIENQAAREELIAFVGDKTWQT